MRAVHSALLAAAMALAATSAAAQDIAAIDAALAVSTRAETEGRHAEALQATRAADRLLPGVPAILVRRVRQAALAGYREEGRAALDALLRAGGGLDVGKAPYTTLFERPNDPLARRAIDLAQPYGMTAGALILTTSDAVIEGMALDRPSGALVFADMHHARIITRATNGSETAMSIPPRYGVIGLLGLKVDPDRRRLWQCARRRTARGETRASLLLLDLRTSSVRRAIDFPGPGKHLCNDVDLLPDGRVVATDSDGGRLWLAAATGRIVPLTTAGALLYPNGVAVAKDGRSAYVATVTHVARVDLTTSSMTRLVPAGGQSLAGIDGLYRLDDRLIAIQNGMMPIRVIDVRLTPDGNLGSVNDIARALPALDEPTTGAIDGAGLRLIANAQFGKLDDSGKLRPGQAIAPTRVSEIALR